MNNVTQTTRAKKILNHPLTPWIMWLLSATFYFYEFLLKVSPSVMIGDLMRSFDVTANEIGKFGAIYFWVYAPMQIVVGLLLDRFGPHRLLTAATGACALGTLMFGMTEHFYIAMLGRALIGLGSAFAIVGCMKIIANWFPSDRFAFMLGLVLTIGMIGAIAGQAPLFSMIEHFGDWRKTMYILSAAGIVLMLLMLLVLRDRPDQELLEDHPPKIYEPSIRQGLRTVLHNRQFWLAAIYGGLMFAPTELFAFWGVNFLTRVYEIPKLDASEYASVVFVGWAVGSPILGWIADKIQRRLPNMYIGTCFSFICMSLIVFVPNIPIPLLVTLLFCFGFFSSGFLSAFAIVKEINPIIYSATALGLMNAMNMLGGAILPHVMGKILDFYWDGQRINGEPFYSISNYQIMMSILPAVLLLSFIFIPFIKETYCRPYRESILEDADVVMDISE